MMVEINFTAKEWHFTGSGVKAYSGAGEQCLASTVGGISMVQRGGYLSNSLTNISKNN